MNDFTIVKDGSVFLLRANSAAGQDWIDENVPIASWGGEEIDGQTVSPAALSASAPACCALRNQSTSRRALARTRHVRRSNPHS